MRLFGRARSAGISLLLGTQELADLRPPGTIGWRAGDRQPLSLLIAHRQVVPASAELIAGLRRLDGGLARVSRHSGGATTRTRQRAALLIQATD